MIRHFWIIFKFVFENAPNVGFWIGVLYLLRNWYSQQNILIKTVFFVVPVIAIIIILRRTYRELKSQFLEVNVESGLKEKRATKRESRVRHILKNLPSKRELVVIYKYASNYARSWASDGEVEDVNYYLTLDGNQVKKSVQIYIRSQLRRDLLAFYLPRRYQKIEEFDEYGRSIAVRIPHIYSFKYWREAIENVLENSTSNIEKSDKIRLQISPSVDSLSINLTFEKGDREWKNHYSLKENKLEHKNKVISTLD